MLAIRLTRMGAKKRPTYRIIVSEKRYKNNGAFVERLGHYNPLTEPTTLVYDKERFEYWLKQGAQPSDTIKRLLLGVRGTKHGKPKKDQPAAEETAAAPAEVASTTTEEVTEAETPAETPEETPETNEETPAETVEEPAAEPVAETTEESKDEA